MDDSSSAACRKAGQPRRAAGPFVLEVLMRVVFKAEKKQAAAKSCVRERRLLPVRLGPAACCVFLFVQAKTPLPASGSRR